MAEHLQVDLLRQRREELGLSPKPLVSPKQLLTKGAAYGLVPLAVVLLVGAGMVWRQQQLQASVLELQPDANLHDSLLQGNIKLQGQVLKLNQANKSLVDGLLAVRSSSAFLTALAALTPQGCNCKPPGLIAALLALRARRRRQRHLSGSIFCN